MENRRRQAGGARPTRARTRVSAARSTVPHMPIMVPPDALSDAAALFGVSVGAPLDRSGAPDGAVYPCERDGTAAFLKLAPVADGTVAAAHDRVALAEHLRGHVGTITHLPSRSGDLLEVVPDGDTMVLATLTARAPGRHLQMPADFTPTVIRAWASTLGRIHAATSAWTGGGSLPTWTWEHDHFLAGCRDDAVGAAWVALGTELARLPTDPAGFGVVHNDLHSGNLLLADDGSLTVLDLDVAAQHWYATDLAILLVHPIWDLRRRDPAAIQPFVGTAVSAYLEQYPLPDARLADVPLLMRYRMTLFVLAMQAELQDRRSPPWLGTLRAWVLSDEPIAPLVL